jgi:hypothetical protein
MNCNNCDIELFEATSEQGTSLFYCKNKFCKFYGKSMNTFLNMPKIKPHLVDSKLFFGKAILMKFKENLKVIQKLNNY